MIERHIVFGKNEKKHLVNILMKTHFSDFIKFDSKIKNMPSFYVNPERFKITMDYTNNIFSYSGEISKNDLLAFKNHYKKYTNSELNIINRKSIFP